MRSFPCAQIFNQITQFHFADFRQSVLGHGGLAPFSLVDFVLRNSDSLVVHVDDSDILLRFLAKDTGDDSTIIQQENDGIKSFGNFAIRIRDGFEKCSSIVLRGNLGEIGPTSPPLPSIL